MAERIAVIDYGAGNLRSVAKAVEAAADGLGRDVQVLVTASPETVGTADRIVLPGVGAFGQCAAALRSLDGMETAMGEAVNARGVPFLGVCVGMQLLSSRGSEHGVHQGLGWIAGEVVKLDPADPMLKVPHMGWNAVRFTLPGFAHPVLKALPDAAQAYFVHSYAFRVADRAHLLGTTDYGGEVAAIVGRDTILGVQFHPEKSQSVGLAFLTAFLEWRP
jgi:imidazole glycerol-phosphate synthase subunit HisH